MRKIAIAGRSGSGKTHLIERLVVAFTAQGLAVSTVKHTHHHEFEIDSPGKDSWRHRQAGAQETLLVSDTRFALLGDLPRPMDLAGIESRLRPADLLLVEGFAELPAIPRIEVFRSFLGVRPLAADGRGFVAIASPDGDRGEPVEGVSYLDLDDTAAIAEFILALPVADSVPGAGRRGPSTRLIRLRDG